MIQENKHDNLDFYFLRHGKLLLPYKDHSQMPMEVLIELAARRLNPPIDQKVTLELLDQLAASLPLVDCQIIYASPAKRCQATAALLAEYIQNNYQRSVEIITREELIEVNFDLQSIARQYRLTGVDINKINNLVYAAIASGENCESFQNIFQRVKKLFDDVAVFGHSSPCIFITHDFYLRVVEIYARNAGILPQFVTVDIIKDTLRNTYLKGFAFKKDFSSFMPLS